LCKPRQELIPLLWAPLEGSSDLVRHSGEALYNSRMAGQAGTHLDLVPMESRSKWTPAYAGVTKIVVDQSFLRGDSIQYDRVDSS
ncbi:MAG TPA: hypothetical protein PK817_14180, partial [Dokdonella sp.]|nr:hypothetical protein [Dokdonella sp.]